MTPTSTPAPQRAGNPQTVKGNKNKKATNKAADKRSRAATLLADNVQKLMNSDTYKAALRLKAKLYQYSFKNCLLIYLQNPEASMIAGYRVWQQHGRQVKKGEKSLAIFAPMTKRNDDGEKELIGFKTASVFDVSQTEGDEIPEMPRPHLLTGTSQSICIALYQLEQYAIAQGYKVKRKANLNGANGSYNPNRKQIIIRGDLEPLHQLKTLTHELAHALLHTNLNPTDQSTRSTAELEAESCAFIVCDSLGLDTSQYSFPYLASWTDDPAQVLPAAHRAAKAAERILEAIQPNELEELAA